MSRCLYSSYEKKKSEIVLNIFILEARVINEQKNIFCDDEWYYFSSHGILKKAAWVVGAYFAYLPPEITIFSILPAFGPYLTMFKA